MANERDTSMIDNTRMYFHLINTAIFALIGIGIIYLIADAL